MEAHSSDRTIWPVLARRLAVLVMILAPWRPAAQAAEAPPPPATNPSQVREEDAIIAKLTARLLEKNHFLQQDIDDEVSRRLLDRYLDTLDYYHLILTQQDIAEFQRYSTTLDDALNAGDLSPAFQIFTRFLERQQERVDYARELLARPERFDFNRDESFIADRHKLSRPANTEEARALWFARLKFDLLQEKVGEKKKGDLRNIADTLIRRYERNQRFLKARDAEEIVADFLTSLAHVYDPHSDFMSREELESFAINMQLSLFGIGAVLSSEDGYCTIQKLIPGGPAERSKLLKPKDRIVKVAQGDGEPVDVVEMNLNKVVELIRGPKGTSVRLTVLPADTAEGGERRQITLIRDEIKLEDQRANAKVIDLPANAPGTARRVAVVDLPSFYSPMEVGNNGGTGQSTTQDMEKLLRKLQAEGIEGIVLDLRRNGGGSLEEAINLTGLFIPEGPVVQVRDARGRTAEHADTDGKVLYAGPMVVLTSRLSASAAEIVAGALQDYGRAVLVGDAATHGKGTVQSLVELGPLMRRMVVPFWTRAPSEDPGALKLTVQKFYRASGSSTQLKGVQPDVILPSVNDFAEFGEASLENPLPWDEIGSATFEPVHLVESCLPEIRQRSAARVSADREFAYIRRDFERRKKIIEEKAISLNEATRLHEQAEIKDEMKERQKERSEHGPAQDVVHLLPMAKVNEAGLPPPEPPRKIEEENPDISPTETAEPDDGAEEKGPLLDPATRESVHILCDLIELQAAQRKRERLAAVEPPAPGAPRTAP